MGVYIKTRRRKNRKFGKFPESKVQTTGDSNMFIEPRNCRSSPEKHDFLSDM